METRMIGIPHCSQEGITKAVSHQAHGFSCSISPPDHDCAGNMQAEKPFKKAKRTCEIKRKAGEAGSECGCSFGLTKSSLMTGECDVGRFEMLGASEKTWTMLPETGNAAVERR